MVQKSLADKLTRIAIKQLLESTKFKQPRMEQIKKYEDAYVGRVQSKLRQTFNMPNLVFSGMVDTLISDFDDPISLKFKEQDPADYKAIKKVNAHWKVEASSLRSSARWDLKCRWDKKMAIFSGRGIQKTYADSTDGYRNHFYTVDYRYFHNEPQGGGNLEDHLFCGEEAIFKTREQLEEGVEEGIYDKEQVAKIISKLGDSEYKDNVRGIYGDKLNRFTAMGLDAESNNYVGQEVLNLCEWEMTYGGKRYHIVFDPWTQEWIRCDLLKDVFSSDLYQWTSWSTHEDPKVFWNKSFADDFYVVGDGIKTLLDQELTNRQKRNLGAKGYDKKFFPDVGKLDAAQYRPDALVPITVPEGKSVKDGIFMFETPELQGTISLVNFFEQELGKHTGVTEIQQAATGKGKGANVQYTILQQAQKRIGSKAKSYIECYQEIGLRYMFGLIDHMTEAISVKVLGKDGFAWEELKRSDLKFKKPFDTEIINQTEEDKSNVLGKDQKIKAIEMISGNPELLQQNNPKVLNEMIWRHIGGMSDEDITEVTDLGNYGQKDILSEADSAINKLMKGKMPKVYFDATSGFIQRIHRFERANQNELGPEKSKMFLDYIDMHMQIVQENMAYQAKQMQMQKAASGQPQEAAQQQSAPPSPPQNPIARSNPGPMLARPAMSA